MLAGHRWAMRGINQAQPAQGKYICLVPEYKLLLEKQRNPPSAHNCSQASAQGEGGDQGGQRKVQLEKKGAPEKKGEKE